MPSDLKDRGGGGGYYSSLESARARVKIAVRDTLEDYNCWEAVDSEASIIIICCECLRPLKKDRRSVSDAPTVSLSTTKECTHRHLHHEDCFNNRRDVVACKYCRDDIKSLGEAGG